MSVPKSGQYSLNWIDFPKILSLPSHNYGLGKKVKSLGHVWLFAAPWTVAYQAVPSMGFSRQEYWSGLPFHCPEGLGEMPKLKPYLEPTPGILSSSSLWLWCRTHWSMIKPVASILMEIYGCIQLCIPFCLFEITKSFLKCHFNFHVKISYSWYWISISAC